MKRVRDADASQVVRVKVYAVYTFNDPFLTITNITLPDTDRMLEGQIGFMGFFVYRG